MPLCTWPQNKGYTRIAKNNERQWRVENVIFIKEKLIKDLLCIKHQEVNFLLEVNRGNKGNKT